MALTPLDPALIPEENTEWRTWFNNKNKAEELLAEITRLNAPLSNSLFPNKVLQYGHWIATMLTGYPPKLEGDKNEGVKYSQLRRFVNGLKDIAQIKMWTEQEQKLRMFQVHLVHGYSRQESLEPFYTVIQGIIANNGLIRSHPKEAFQADFLRLMDLVDAITAYYEILKTKENQ